ncbi:MAG: transglycosylase SLT domain-containing protein [Chloroflexi bacterium]|nr:transglycosylase SLT domain-containing protein [Chloroflexota bacterium]
MTRPGLPSRLAIYLAILVSAMMVLPAPRVVASTPIPGVTGTVAPPTVTAPAPPATAPVATEPAPSATVPPATPADSPVPPSPMPTAAPAVTTLPPTATALPDTPTPVPPTEIPAAASLTPAPPTVTLREGGRVHVAPEQVSPGETLDVAAADFGERERLSVWLTDGDGSVIGSAERTTTRDGQAYFSVPLPADAAPGRWSISVQGQLSRRRAVAAFVVLGGVDDAGSEPDASATGDVTRGDGSTTPTTATLTPSPTATATMTPTATVTRTPPPDNRDIAAFLPPGPPGGSLSPRLARTYFGNAARISGVPVEVLLAVAAVESGFRPNAVGPYLPQFAGTIDEHALGMMQFLPSTYQAYVRRVDRLTGKNLGLRGIWDPESAVYAAALYLSDSGAPGDMRRALYRYNNAEWYVRLVLAWADYYARGGTIGGAPVIDLSRLPDIPSPATPVVGDGRPAVRAAGPPSLADAHAPRLSALPEGLLELLGQIHDRLGWPKIQLPVRPLPI